MPYTNYTLTQLLGLLDNQLGASAGVWWTTAEKTGIINEGLRVWNALTGQWRQTGIALGSGTPKATVADQVWYALPGTLTSSMRITFNGIPLYPSSLHDLDQGQMNWESETTVSGGMTSPSLWAPAGLNLIAIWPADHAGGNALWCDGIAVTPILVNPGDYIDIGDQELNALLDYWQHIAMFKDGGKEFETSTEQMKSFLKAAASTNAMLLASSRFREFMGMDLGRAESPRSIKPERVGSR